MFWPKSVKARPALPAVSCCRPLHNPVVAALPAIPTRASTLPAAWLLSITPIAISRPVLMRPSRFREIVFGMAYLIILIHKPALIPTATALTETVALIAATMATACGNSSHPEFPASGITAQVKLFLCKLPARMDKIPVKSSGKAAKPADPVLAEPIPAPAAAIRATPWTSDDCQ